MGVVAPQEGDEDGVRVEVALAGGADDRGEGLLCAGSPPGAIPAADLARNDGAELITTERTWR